MYYLVFTNYNTVHYAWLYICSLLGDNLLSVVRSTPLSVLIWQPPTNIGVSISYYLIQLYDKAIKKQQWTLHTMQILNVTVELGKDIITLYDIINWF